jgi:nitrate reductase beta subunit
MKVRAQIGMVLNLDKCIGCHTCSVTCKNVWTSRPGVEYAWFNNVETKPGIGYPKDWENQDKWKVAGPASADGSIEPRQGGKWKLLMRCLPTPTCRRSTTTTSPSPSTTTTCSRRPPSKATPTARPRSLITGKRMEKIEWGPNWEEILGGEFSKRSKDANLDSFDQVQKDMVGQFENTFMMYLPRLCEHCLNPACVASCPSGSIYKREDDGIVLIDQDKCRGWRMCVSGCPYKKIYYNWQSGKAEKCIFCYPRIEAGQPTVCSETCVGRIRYLGVVLYDADRIAEAASVADDKDLYQAQLDIFLDPHDPKVIEQARKDGVPEAWLEGARNSPVYKMAMDWKVALPLHPEYRTLPMVWYVPPLSPITSAANAGHIGAHGELPDLKQMRIPVQYLANLLTAGDTAPVERSLNRMLAMRAYQRSKHVDQVQNLAVLYQAGLSEAQVEEMYQIMAIANYEDRFVIPSSHREYAENTFDMRGGCGFSFGNGCSDGETEPSLFGGKKRRTIPIQSTL